jgi:hypothetical protein
MAFALALLTGHIGFFGHEGAIWAVIGFLVFCCVVAILFKIVFLALPALGVTEPWISIIFWVLVLILLLAFVNYAFGWGY